MCTKGKSTGFFLKLICFKLDLSYNMQTSVKIKKFVATSLNTDGPIVPYACSHPPKAYFEQMNKKY